MIDKVAVIGAGAWGTTIANLLAYKGVRILLWSHSVETVNKLKKQQSPYLPGVTLFPSIESSTSLDTVLTFSPYWILAKPSRYLPDLVSLLHPHINERIHVLSLVKGMVLNREQPLWVSDYLLQMLPELTFSHFTMLSGPNFALEIAKGLFAASVVASLDEEEGKCWQSVLSTPFFRVYTNTDIIGVQLGGVMKNIIALAAGILDGMQLGTNLKSALIVRGIYEMKRLAALVGANPETLAGLSGLGDLIGTCTSPLSRNLWAGTLIGQGKTIDDIAKTQKTVEGIDALPAVLAMAKNRIEMPISESLYAILFQQKPVMEALSELMIRTAKPE
jgi:glycerol-3-phosphate dehydrogenase (NAD(P)+)